VGGLEDVDVLQVLGLPRVHVSTVPQADPAAGRRRQEVGRQLPRVEPVGVSWAPTTVQVSVLRHL